VVVVGGRGLSSCEHFSDKGKGFFRCGHPHFLVQKTSGFRNLWCVRTVKERGGLSQCRHFADKGEGVNFSQFFADIFYGQSQKT